MSRLAVVLALVVISGCRCGPLLPVPPKQCTPDGFGCLSDEICIDFQCLPRPKCGGDADCGSPAFQCVLPAQVCSLREGFGQECHEPDAPCDPGLFCALGVCHELDPALQCSVETDCAPGQKCDRVHFQCIEDADCRLEADFPELACDSGEECDQLSGHCALPCTDPPICTVDADCPLTGERCNGSCRCVQCITNDDCGPGLVCDERAGSCRSENLCFTDNDCTPPLICDQSTQQCQVAPPACESDFDCAFGQSCNIVTTRCEFEGGECVDDFFEDADTPSSARPLTLNLGQNPAIDELTLCPNDDDVYSVILGAGDVLIAQVSNTDPAARATMWLLDASGETSLDFAETAPRGNGIIAYVAPQDETVFIRLTALIHQTNYSLQLTRDNGVACSADSFDDPTPNDSTLTATPPERVPDGVNLVGTICSNDLDFYRIDVAAGEALSTTVSFDPTQSDLDVAYLDDQGRLIVQSAGVTAPETLRQRFPFAGTVYVRVKGFGNSTGSYTMQVNHEPRFQCTDDVAEPADNDVATAPVLPLNQELGPEDRTMCQGDVDLMQAPLEDFERIIASTLYNDSDVELAIDILDATGTTVLATSPPATGGAAVSYDAQGNETVIVRVRGVNGAIGPYQLHIEKENQLDCTPDALEPNNAVETRSAPPAPGQLMSICANDQDFFAIDGHEGKRLVVDASFRQDEADLDLILLGLDGSQILAAADGTSDGEHLEFTLPLDGTYTLRVFSLTSGAKARYSLSIQETD